MAPLTVSNYLGMLQDDPDDAKALEGLRATLSSEDPQRAVRLIEAARQGHAQRGELRAAAALIEIETGLIQGDPDLEAALFKELGRLRNEDLLDDEGALAAYQQALSRRPGDDEVQDAIETIQAAAKNWKEIASRFVEEAEGASDATLKTSLLVRAAALVWQYKKKGKEKEVDKLFKRALEADPTNTRAALLYEETLRPREKWGEIAEVLLHVAEHARNRDEKLNLYIRAARILGRKLGEKDRAAACYERVLDFAPGHEEGLSFLVEYFTERENWEHLVALYEDALRARHRPESEQGILLQIGMVHWRIRKDPVAAEPYFARLRKIDPSHPGMLAFYRDHLAQTGDAGRLLTVLGDAQRISSDSKDKLSLAVEIARAAQTNEATLERAIDAWKAVQRLDPQNQEAPGALKELYRRAEKWNSLVEVLKAEIDALPAGEGARKVELLRQMIPIYRDRLSLDVMVINTYNAILQLAPDDVEALAALAKTYEAMGRWNDLIQVLTRQADAAPRDAKVALYMRVAHLWIERFANYNQATRPLEQVIEIEPENREALALLKDIYAKKRAWKSLYEVLEKEAQLASDPSARTQLEVELAKLAGERLHRHADAIAIWRRVLSTDASVPGGLDALEKLAEREKDWGTLAEALEIRVRAADDPAARVKILQRLGQVYGEQVQDPAKAATAWKRVLEIDPKNGKALRTLRESFLAAGDWEALEKLYAEVNDWEGLVEVLGTAAEKASDPAAKVRLSFRAAELYEKQIKEPQRAFRSYERVLSVDPKNARAARALVPIYEKDEKWAKLVALFEVILGDTKADAERLELVNRLRVLSRDKLSDEQAAWRWAARAYELAPSDPEVRRNLEMSTEKTHAHEKLVQLYTARIEQADTEEAIGLRRRVAAIAAEKLGKTNIAVEQLRAIVAHDRKDADAIAALDRIYRRDQRPTELRDLYLHRIENSADETERWVALGELARLEEEQGMADEAAAHYRAMLSIEETDRDALAALDRLTTKGERWDELAEVLGRRVTLAANDSERVELLMRLADLQLDKLEGKRAALDLYAQVLAAQPAHPGAVRGLEKLESDPAMAIEVGRLLEGAYEKSGAHPKLAEVLRRRLAATKDEHERRELRLRVAELSATVLGDAQGAYRAVEEAFLDRPSDADLWDRLAQAAERAGKHDALATAYATAIDAGGLAASEGAELARRVAQLYDEVLARPADAEPYHRRVLSTDPLDERSFLALKELYTTSERWDELQVLYRNRIAQTTDADAKLDLLMQVCFLFEEILDDPVLAIRAYQDVLELDPDNVASRRALERLYLRTQRWRDLVALLHQELANATGPDAIDLMFRLGELHERRLSEPGPAVDQYEAVLKDQPTHLRAQEALERLLADPSQRQRIAGILEPIYDAQGAWSELARILEVQLEDIGDPGSRVVLLLRIAELHEHRLHDMDGAFRALARAVEGDPSDGRAREELGRIAGLRNMHRDRAEVLEKAIARASDQVGLLGELLLELARLWDDAVGDHEAAERAWQRLIEVDRDNPEAVLSASRALERIHLEKGDHHKLAQDLERQVKLENDQETRKRLLVRLADLYDDVLEDPAAAIRTHAERLDLDPADVDAMRALERLYEKQGEWQRLIGVLQSRENVTEDQDERRRIARRVGQIYEEKLDDRDDAIVAYNEVVSRFGRDAETLAALARLYEAGEKWEDLLEVVQMEWELAGEGSNERAELRFKAAELMRKRTDQLERSIEAYSEVLDQVPDHEGAIAALEEVILGESSSGRTAAARVLAPRYEAGQRWKDLLMALEVLAESEDGAERLRSLRRAAEVADVGLNDAGKAFHLVGKAVRAGLAEDDLPFLLGELERLTVASGRYQEYVTLLKEVTPDVLDADLQTTLYAKVAETASSRLQDAALAREYWQKVLEQKPDHAGALDALEQLDEAAGDYRALVEILERKTDLALADVRVRLLLRRAEICETKLDDTRAAIEAYERVLEEVERPEPYDGLERLYAKAERWNDLGLLYERQLEKNMGDPTEIRHKLGRVYLDRLEEPAQAIDQFREALAREPGHLKTIAALENMMEKPEHRAEAAAILEPVYLGKMDWANVTRTIEARVEAESELEGRKKLLARLGEIHEDHLEDLEGAMETYARLFREDPSDETVWDTLARLARVLEKHARLAEIYGEALDGITVDEPYSAKLAFLTGKLHDEKTGNLEKAAELYARALRFDPTEKQTFEALEAVYLRQQAWQPLLELYREQAQVAETDAARIGLLQKSARTYENALGDLDRAIDLWREILEVDPRDRQAVETMDSLLVRRERWSDLADHLRHRIDLARGTKDEVELSYRLGQVLAGKLDDKTGAIDVYEEITRQAPNHAPTVTALEVLVQDVEHRLRITEILDPIYRRDDQWKKLVAILEAQAELKDDPQEKVRLLSEVARLHEERGRDGSRAFDGWARSFALDPSDVTARTELDRLAGLGQLWDAHVAAYEAALANAGDPALVGSLLATMARVHDEKRGDPRAAIETYERLIKHDESDPTPLDSLEALHTMVGDWRGLVDVLHRKVERSYNNEERGDLLRRAGSVLEELIGDRAGAIEAYRRAAEEDDSDLIAYESLDRLYRETQQHAALARVLQRRIELETDPNERVDHALRLGQLAEEQLHQPDEAIQAFQRVLEDHPGHPAAITALARLYERQGMWAELLENLKLQAGMAESPAERVRLQHRAGEVLERELDDVSESISMYQQALEVDPAHEPSIVALRRISASEDFRVQASEILEPLLRAAGRWDDLAEILERGAEAAMDPLQKRAELRRVAEVHEQGRRRPEDAFEAYRRALAEDASDAATADDIERLAAQLGAWDRAADTFAARAGGALDPQAGRALWVRLARIAETHLQDDTRAIEAYQRALEQVGDEEELLAALDRLLDKAGQSQELADVIERRIALAGDPTQRAELSIRLGTLREEKFGDKRGALGAFQEVIERDPSEPRALAALERLVQDPDMAMDVIDVLDNAYRSTGATAKRAQLYDVRIRQADSEGERVRLLQEVAQIYETELGDTGRALAETRRAFELDPRDETLLGELERLAGASGDFAALRGVVEGVVERGVDRTLRRDLNLRAAQWYRDRLADLPAAEARLRAAIGADEESADAHAQLVELLRNGDRAADLVAALRAWAKVETDEYAKKDRLREAARLAESALGDAATAAACHEAILAVDGSDAEALDDLARIRMMEQRWTDVVDLLARRIDVESDPSRRVQLRQKLAEVYADAMEDPEKAIEAYRGVLDEVPDDRGALEALEALYEKGARWADLNELLERRLDLAQSTAERAAARVRIARLQEQRFGKRKEAIEQLREIIAEDARNGEALDELERLLTADERWDEVVELLERRAEDAAGANDKAGEVAVLIRLADVHLQRRQDPRAAAGVLDRVLGRDAWNAGALASLVRIHQSLEDWPATAKALDQLGQVQEGAQAVATMHRLAEIAEGQLGDAPRAEAALRRAFELDGGSAATRELLKTHYDKHGQWAKLAEMLLLEEKETAAGPGAKDAKVALLKKIADIYAQKLQDPASAAQTLERAAALVPEDRNVLLPLCDLYIAAGRQKDAIPVLEKIISSYGTRRTKDVAQFYHRIGQALEGLGDTSGALERYDAAFKIDLTNVQVLRDLGRLCHRAGDFDRAQKTFRALLLQKLDPATAGITKADVYYYLGDISAKQGDKPKAISMLERAVAEQSSHADARALLTTLKS